MKSIGLTFTAFQTIASSRKLWPPILPSNVQSILWCHCLSSKHNIVCTCTGKEHSNDLSVECKQACVRPMHMQCKLPVHWSRLVRKLCGFWQQAARGCGKFAHYTQKRWLCWDRSRPWLRLLDRRAGQDIAGLLQKVQKLEMTRIIGPKYDGQKLSNRIWSCNIQVIGTASVSVDRGGKGRQFEGLLIGMWPTLDKQRRLHLICCQSSRSNQHVRRCCVILRKKVFFSLSKLLPHMY